MRTRRLLVDAVTVFAVTLGITALVTLLWNTIGHRSATVDWETSFRFAIVLGIILPWIATRRSKET
jgi:hypothetical protein